MFHLNWKKELFTIPNLLSLFRLFLIPVYTRMYLNASREIDYYLAGSILGVSCLTDLADGMIAREFNMISEFGKILDPLADKLTQLSLILLLSRKYRFFLPLLSLFLLKEIFQCVMLILFLQKGKVLGGALPAGKISTTVLFISLAILLTFPNVHPSIGKLLIYTDTAFLLLSFYSYAQAYLGRNPKLNDLKTE